MLATIPVAVAANVIGLLDAVLGRLEAGTSDGLVLHLHVAGVNHRGSVGVEDDGARSVLLEHLRVLLLIIELLLLVLLSGCHGLPNEVSTGYVLWGIQIDLRVRSVSHSSCLGVVGWLLDLDLSLLVGKPVQEAVLLISLAVAH